MDIELLELDFEDVDLALELIDELNEDTELTARLLTSTATPIASPPQPRPGRQAHLGPAEITTIAVSAASVASALISLATAIVNWKTSRAKKSGEDQITILIVNDTTPLNSDDPRVLAQQLQEKAPQRLRITQDPSPASSGRSKKRRRS